MEFEDIITALNKMTDGLDPESIYWIKDAAGPDWCFICGKAMAKHLRRRSPRKTNQEYILDGGYDPSHVVDGPAFCEGCGKLLSFSLTEYGVSEEIIAYSEGIQDIEKLSKEDAWVLSEVFESGQHYDDLLPDLRMLAENLGCVL